MRRLTHARLLELLDYDSQTGLFRWKVRTGHGKVVGDNAGCMAPTGYRHIRLDGTLYKASRLAWFFTFGEWPSQLVDHINRNRGDDRLANLRETTTAQNAANMRLRNSNKSGFKGVHFNKQARKWVAQISGHHIGSFDNPEDAARAYDKAALSRFGEFASTNKEMRL